jgi:hypothetical protein
MQRATGGGNIPGITLQPPIEVIAYIDRDMPERALAAIDIFKEGLAPLEMKQIYDGWKNWAKLSPEYTEYGNFLRDVEDAVFSDVKYDQVAYDAETAIDDTPPSLRATL